MVWSWDAVDWNLVIGFGMLALVLAFAVFAAILCDGGWSKLSKRSRILFSCLCLFPFVLLLSAAVAPAYGPWEKLGEGVYDHVEYTDTRVKKVPVGYYTKHDTILYFTDGRALVMPGLRDIDFQRGTPIVIWTKNGFYKIEKARDPSTE